MANSKRKCKNCKTYQPAANGIVANLGFFCSNDCRYEFGINNAKRLAEKSKETRAKKERKEIKQAKEKLKTAGDYIKEAQTAVNRYIRLRDYGKPCISCGARHEITRGGKFDAGHYRSRGAASHLRFNTYNVHGQCVRCNRFNSGNVVDYRINLINKIGLERVERLEQDNTPRKFTIDYLKRIKRIFNKRANRIEKRLRQSGVLR